MQIKKMTHYVISERLQNIAFTHRTGSMFEKPGVDAGLVKDVPEWVKLKLIGRMRKGERGRLTCTVAP